MENQSVLPQTAGNCNTNGGIKCEPGGVIVQGMLARGRHSEPSPRTAWDEGVGVAGECSALPLCAPAPATGGPGAPSRLGRRPGPAGARRVPPRDAQIQPNPPLPRAETLGAHTSLTQSQKQVDGRPGTGAKPTGRRGPSLAAWDLRTAPTALGRTSPPPLAQEGSVLGHAPLRGGHCGVVEPWKGPAALTLCPQGLSRGGSLF